ncbi:hypothetical protein CR152_11500 [Massilia violaceinigra]|uniref:Uncharacterized protein n=1 Tax=Massilia violaceinigra TaxID=2045208 RepID=A0A2D2DJB5_9BURK|nr:hypothetical protein [Massilia violaceinigra]ATQ75076.1 hypothetical protein CR152_11500 [Massilia violaceinigra]
MTSALVRLVTACILVVLSYIGAAMYPTLGWALGWPAGLAYCWIVRPWLREPLFERRAVQQRPDGKE